MRVLSPFPHSETGPDADHPCFGCAVRERAVCGVLACDTLGTFKRMGRTLRLKPGQALFHEGDPANRVFTVTRGSVKLYRLLSDGRRQVTGFLFPGDFLGISLGEEHEVSAQAMEDVQLCAFPRSRFGDFVDTHPQMERQLYCLAARQLGAATEQMVLLGRKTALERLATFFIQLRERAARTGQDDGSKVDLPMSRSDIADYLGLTKETVSRLLGQLRRRRLIRLIAIDRIEILDPAGLERLAEDGAEAAA
jgi:CRP/FNR family transcriptional regulator